MTDKVFDELQIAKSAYFRNGVGDVTSTAQYIAHLESAMQLLLDERNAARVEAAYKDARRRLIDYNKQYREDMEVEHLLNVCDSYFDATEDYIKHLQGQNND